MDGRVSPPPPYPSPSFITNLSTQSKSQTSKHDGNIAKSKETSKGIISQPTKPSHPKQIHTNTILLPPKKHHRYYRTLPRYCRTLPRDYRALTRYYRALPPESGSSFRLTDRSSLPPQLHRAVQTHQRAKPKRPLPSPRQKEQRRYDRTLPRYYRVVLLALPRKYRALPWYYRGTTGHHHQNRHPPKKTLPVLQDAALRYYTLPRYYRALPRYYRTLPPYYRTIRTDTTEHYRGTTGHYDDTTGHYRGTAGHYARILQDTTVVPPSTTVVPPSTTAVPAGTTTQIGS